MLLHDARMSGLKKASRKKRTRVYTGYRTAIDKGERIYIYGECCDGPYVRVG